MHRFYCPSLDQKTLSKEESHHALDVLRLKAGDQCAAFDGRGTEAKIRITAATKHKVEFEILSRAPSPAPKCRLVLGQAVPKGKAMDLILQKATELGMSSIAPILSDRSVVQLDGDRSESKHEKWEQALIEACKQCGQNRVPELQPARKMTALLESLGRAPGLRLVASLQPDAKPLPQVIREAKAQGPIPSITFLVGPEGDFTPAEIGAARGAGFLPVSLGPNILRTETASLYLCSVLSYELESPEK
jgi:16S rRNA (uracil1498-N3)-methyltransferase